jgi:succinate dehydrogenase / fumarate reductase cytochrome b subunit
MNFVSRLFGSTLGKKYLMAVSGAAMGLFVTAHMIGNLELFLGPAAINRYAHFLHSLGELLWGARLGLFAMIGLHIWAAVALSVENKAARPIGYGNGKAPYGASLASRTMLLSGALIALFVVYHLLHYTACVRAVNFVGIDFAHLTDPETGYHDVFAMVVYGFSVWYVALFYIVAVGFLSLHLSHGGSAMFHSLGLRNHAWWPVISKAAVIWAVILFLGFAAVPGAVLAGYGRAYLEKVKTTATVRATPVLVDPIAHAIPANAEVK